MAWQVGKELYKGKYIVEKVLGSGDGGFGHAYCVRQVSSEGSDKFFAIKHLKQDFNESHEDFEHRQTEFMNEAMRLANHKHPHIVKVFPRTFMEGILKHIVMEYVEGENLKQIVKQRHQPLVLDESLRYISQIASALQYIHNLNPPLIHRDVKPANIVIRERNREAVLVDFGTAKEFHEDVSFSAPRILSNGYSPMEIDSNDRKHTYTDVYSLGATLYFLLTAEVPISARERCVTKNDRLVPPKQINPAIPDYVNDAIMAAMERYVDERVQTVTEFMQRLKKPLKLSLLQKVVNWIFPTSKDQTAVQDAQIAEERQQREKLEREAQNQFQQLDAEKQLVADELQRSNKEKEQQAKGTLEARESLEIALSSDDYQVLDFIANAERQKAPKIELLSANGIDYQELEQLLKAQEWRKADELTAKLMLKAVNRERQGWLDEASVRAFPCKDLQTIDQLWIHYSSSKFGFSIQKKIWLEFGGKIGIYDIYAYKVWKKFAAKVGWYHPLNNDWRTYAEFMNDTNNAQNALPASLPLKVVDKRGWDFREEWWGRFWRWWGEDWGVQEWEGWRYSSLALRLTDCKESCLVDDKKFEMLFSSQTISQKNSPSKAFRRLRRFIVWFLLDT